MSFLRPARISALLLSVAGVTSAGRAHAQSSPTGSPAGTGAPSAGAPSASPRTSPSGSSKSTPAPSADLGSDGLGLVHAVQSKFQQLAEQNGDSVVTVTAWVKDDSRAPADPSNTSAGHWVNEGTSHDIPGHKALASCSGFITSLAGDILTCRSLLLKADRELPDVITVETKDGKTTICSLIATEPTLDLALLRFEVYMDGPPRFSIGRFGDSTHVYPGTMTVALGDPAGPGAFLSSALISSLPTRDCYQEQKSATYLQATMIAHPEAYGGPLLNLDGEIVGMLQPRLTHSDALAPFRTTGLEYALPSNIMNTIYQALLQNKSLTSPWIGIAIMSKAELRRERGTDAYDQMIKPAWGVFIENTFDPSPASGAGIRPGDFLVKFDGNPVLEPASFQRLMYLAGIGKEVKLEMFRDGQIFEVKATIVKRPPEAITR